MFKGKVSSMIKQRGMSHLYTWLVCKCVTSQKVLDSLSQCIYIVKSSLVVEVLAHSQVVIGT